MTIEEFFMYYINCCRPYNTEFAKEWFATSYDYSEQWKKYKEDKSHISGLIKREYY